jgi:predicted ribosomally synthesized peptide with SipW-like signal peptide
MKNIITSLGIIVFAGAVVAGATGAFFSDTESSLGNVFTAGSVELVLENPLHTYQNDQTANGNDVPVFTSTGVSFTLNDIKPLDWGAISYGLKNEENPAKVCVLVENKTISDNGKNDALASKMSFKTGSTPLTLGMWADLATLAEDATENYALDYCFGAYNNGTCELAGDDTFYNPAQGGQIELDLEFYAVPNPQQSKLQLCKFESCASYSWGKCCWILSSYLHDKCSFR